MGREWRDVGDSRVGFSYPCEGCYGKRRHRDVCEKPDERHGHIILDTEDGFGRIPLSCYSQSGVIQALLRQDTMSRAEKLAVQSLSNVQLLPLELTAEEERVLNDPDALEKATKNYWFWGA